MAALVYKREVFTKTPNYMEWQDAVSTVAMLLVGAVVLRFCMTGFAVKRIGVKAALPGAGELNVSMEDLNVNNECSNDGQNDREIKPH